MPEPARTATRAVQRGRQGTVRDVPGATHTTGDGKQYLAFLFVLFKRKLSGDLFHRVTDP